MDSNVLESLMEYIAPQKEDWMVEIGPGRGALTHYLIQKTNHLCAVEIDKDLILFLKKNYPHLKLIEGDVLNVDFEKEFNQKPHRFVGNLPYNISSPFLLLLKKYKPLFLNGYFVLQKEVVERLAALPHSKSYGRLSVMMQYDFNCEKCFEIPPECFYPAPKVTSALIKITPKNEKNNRLTVENDILFEKIVFSAFQQRRKMLKNTLKKFVNEEIAKKCEIDLNQRAENLHVADYVRLVNFIRENNETFI